MKKKNTNVIGPISREDWRYMQLLHGSLKYMDSDRKRYQGAIAKEKLLYQEAKEQYVA